MNSTSSKINFNNAFHSVSSNNNEKFTFYPVYRMLLWKRPFSYREREIIWPLVLKCANVQLCMKEHHVKILATVTIATGKLPLKHHIRTMNNILESRRSANAMGVAINVIEKRDIVRY